MYDEKLIQVFPGTKKHKLIGLFTIIDSLTLIKRLIQLMISKTTQNLTTFSGKEERQAKIF